MSIYNHLTLRFRPTPSRLKVCSVSCSFKQYQLFLKSNGSWDLEKLQCKCEVRFSSKINSRNKPFVAYT